MYASTLGVVLANIRATKWKIINVILITRIYRIFLCSDWIGLDKREISLSSDRITVSVCSSPESMLNNRCSAIETVSVSLAARGPNERVHQIGSKYL